MNRIFYLCTVKKTIFFNNLPSFKLNEQDLADWIYECVKEKDATIKRLDINFIKEDEISKADLKKVVNKSYNNGKWRRD